MCIYGTCSQECTHSSVITVYAHFNAYFTNRNGKGDKIEIKVPENILYLIFNGT